MVENNRTNARFLVPKLQRFFRSSDFFIFWLIIFIKPKKRIFGTILKCKFVVFIFFQKIMLFISSYGYELTDNEEAKHQSLMLLQQTDGKRTVTPVWNDNHEKVSIFEFNQLNLNSFTCKHISLHQRRMHAFMFTRFRMLVAGWDEISAGWQVGDAGRSWSSEKALWYGYVAATGACSCTSVHCLVNGNGDSYCLWDWRIQMLDGWLWDVAVGWWGGLSDSWNAFFFFISQRSTDWAVSHWTFCEIRRCWHMNIKIRWWWRLTNTAQCFL